MRIYQFRGMVVRHHEKTGRFEIVGAPSAAEIRNLRFQVPPSFLWWPAKDVIVAVLLVNSLVASAFLVNSTDLSACFLLGTISVSLFFAIGYVYDSFTVIYLHLFFCITQIVASLVILPLAYHHQIICNNELKCKTIFQWISDLGIPFTAPQLYVFVGSSLICHIFMAPISFRLMRFTAAKDALGRMEKTKEERKWTRCV